MLINSAFIILSLLQNVFLNVQLIFMHKNKLVENNSLVLAVIRISPTFRSFIFTRARDFDRGQCGCRPQK